jgi:hypothetical protein
MKGAGMSDNRGFTLLEAIIAVGLSAFVLVLVYSTYIGINSAINAASEGQDVLETGRILLELQKQDLRGAVVSPQSRFKSDIKEIDGELYFSVEFSTTSLMGENPFGVGRVGYSLVKTDDGQKVLVRREARNARDDLIKEGAVFEMSRMVTSFELRFYNGTEWVDKWDSESMGKLPKQVRIAITVSDGKGVTRDFTSDEMIPTAL